MTEPIDDPYVQLGIVRTATLAQIKRAFRRLAKTCHPDLHPDDPAAEERFKALAAAYEMLEDPRRRADYDRRHPAGGGTPAPSPAPPPAPAWRPRTSTQQARAAYARAAEYHRCISFWDFQAALFTVFLFVFLFLGPAVDWIITEREQRGVVEIPGSVAMIVYACYWLLLRPRLERVVQDDGDPRWLARLRRALAPPYRLPPPLAWRSKRGKALLAGFACLLAAILLPTLLGPVDSLAWLIRRAENRSSAPLPLILMLAGIWFFILQPTLDPEA